MYSIKYLIIKICKSYFIAAALHTCFVPPAPVIRPLHGAEPVLPVAVMVVQSGTCRPLHGALHVLRARQGPRHGRALQGRGLSLWRRNHAVYAAGPLRATLALAGGRLGRGR